MTERLKVNSIKIEVKPFKKSMEETIAAVRRLEKGEKIRVAKFKAKSRYRKVMGFRPQHSVVQIEKIDSGVKKVAEKPNKLIKTAPNLPKK